MRALSAFWLILLTPFLYAGVPKNLPYPTTGDPLTADTIAAQVYFVNHFYSLRNYSIKQKGDIITTVINRAKGSMPTTNSVERYVNNDYHDGKIKSKDLVIFRSGRLRGTGMLITDFEADDKSQVYEIWLPALRRIRRFAEPAHEDAWSGSDFTFGDVYLRKPEHETHELMGEETFRDCLGRMEIPAEQRNRYMQDLPEASCLPQGKKVYKLKSVTQFNDWWYDYRISYIDVTTFADYRSDFYKNGRQVKRIDRAWRPLQGYQGKDPRALSWVYWYGKNYKDEHESWAIIPSEIVFFNEDVKESFWTPQTLRKLRR